MIIVVDGNDGTGKTTLVNSLRELGFDAVDRGLPTRATIDGLPNEIPKDETYIILDAPVGTSRDRLANAGKDLNECWHTVDSLTFYRQKFREIAEKLKLPLFDATRSAAEVLEDVKHHLDRSGITLTEVKDHGMPRWRNRRIGIPKGRLLESSIHLLSQAGFLAHPEIGEDRTKAAVSYSIHRMLVKAEVRRKYKIEGSHGIDYYILKARSIPQMVALDLLDGGFCGRDLVEESNYEYGLDMLDLNQHKVRLVAAAANPNIIIDPPPLLRIATEFPSIASQWATSRNLAHICINTWGSTEAWVPEFCDLIVDTVETGNTLKANGLHELETLLLSSLVFISKPHNQPVQGLVARLSEAISP